MIRVNASDPVRKQVFFQISDFFLTAHEHVDGVGVFQTEEFEDWFSVGKVEVHDGYASPDGKLDKDKLYKAIRDLEQKAGPDMKYEDLDDDTEKSLQARTTGPEAAKLLKGFGNPGGKTKPASY